jgi:hypothetical protein
LEHIVPYASIISSRVPIGQAYRIAAFCLWGLTEKTTTGKVITRLAPRGLSPGAQLMHPVRNGIEMLPQRDELITLEHVQYLPLGIGQ